MAPTSSWRPFWPAWLHISWGLKPCDPRQMTSTSMLSFPSLLALFLYRTRMMIMMITSVQCVSKNATLTILTIPWYHDIMILYKHCKPYSVISYISYVCLNSVKFICSYFHSLSEWTKTMAGVFLQKKQDQSTRTTFSNAFAWKLRGERIRSGVAWDLCRIKISKAKLDSVQFFRTLIQFRDLY